MKLITSIQWRLSSSRFNTVLTIWRHGGVPVGHSHQIKDRYAKIFATGPS
jgi:hypothetical protein